MDNKITVQVLIAADRAKVWTYYTSPNHIVNWNFASEEWCCPSASNDFTIGGRYVARMESRDGKYGFNFEAIYEEITLFEFFKYAFGDRTAIVDFMDEDGQTKVVVSFDPEKENSIEVQKQGWQAILNNFKKYTESH